MGLELWGDQLNVITTVVRASVLDDTSTRGVLEFLSFGKDALPSQRLRQWKWRLDVDGLLTIKPEAAVKAGSPYTRIRG